MIQVRPLVLFSAMLALSMSFACGTKSDAGSPEEKAVPEARAEETANDPSTAEKAPDVLSAASTMIGFSPRDQGDQEIRERTIRARIKAENCDTYLKRLTQTPHLAGTDANLKTADYVAQLMRSWGYQVETTEYHVLLPYPKSIEVEMVAPRAFAAGLREQPMTEDLDTQTPDAVMPYIAYSPDCDMTAPLVYANYGTAEDFAELDKMGVDVRGQIVLVRYGKIFRGSKAKLAEERGAAGLILYSDPADDGFAKGDVYPKGPYRPASAVQRGSILYIFEHPGDPGTPGRPSMPDAEQLRYGDMTSLPLIPTTCISYEDAEPFLRELDGFTVPESWKGALPFAYHVGGTGSVKVHLKIEMDDRLRVIRNTIATMPGIQFPDETIVVGNHRDAWVFGAVDPSSGTAVMLEAARAIADVKKGGRPPRRTIKFATWDAEEFGMIGSTEWGEQFAAELTKNCVAYINVDAAVSGPNLGASGVPSLQSFVMSALEKVPGPSGEASRARELVDGNGRPKYGSLGSGSDYAVFLNHLGIPCLDFSSSGPYGVYHSLFDSYLWMRRNADPQFLNHASMAQVMATVTTRLADAAILPHDFTTTGEFIADAARTLEERYPKLDLREIKKIADEVSRFGADINRAVAQKLAGGATNDQLVRWNAILLGAERKLLMTDGYATRSWFRHVLFAPRRRLGYGGGTLPPLEDFLERGDNEGAQKEAGRVMESLRAFRDQLSLAATVIAR